MKSDKSRRARLQAESLFSGLKTTASSAATDQQDPFAEEDVDVDEDPPVFRGRVPVTLSTRIELRGYPTANIFMKVIADAWGLDWYEIKGACAVARLPEGWTFEITKEGVTEVIDARRRRRAMSKIAGEQQSFLKVLPRYFIDGSKGLENGDGGATWEIGVRDREEGEVSIHWGICDASRESIESEKGKLSRWLDEKYPSHRDPFAYWSDCAAGAR